MPSVSSLFLYFILVVILEAFFSSQIAMVLMCLHKANFGNEIVNVIALRGGNCKGFCPYDRGPFLQKTKFSLFLLPPLPSFLLMMSQEGMGTKSQRLDLGHQPSELWGDKILFYINHLTSGIVLLQHQTDRDRDRDLCKPFHLCRRGLIHASSVKQKRLVGFYYSFE